MFSFGYQTKNWISFLISILVGIILGLGIITLVKKNKTYYAVFLTNGSVYFGKLSNFPKLKIDNSIFFQIDQNGQVSFQRFSDAFWMPKGSIYLNRDSILFIAPISENSPLVNLIEGRQVPAQQSTQTQTQTQISTTTP